MPANDNDRRADPKPIANDDGGASLALMITRQQRARLLALGTTEAALHVMTPAEAHRRLRDAGEPPRSD